MAEFQIVAKEKRRMCSVFPCDDCPISMSETACSIWMFSHPEEAERIIMEWAKENPEPDKDLDELKKLLGDDKITINQLVKWIVEGYKRIEEKNG